MDDDVAVSPRIQHNPSERGCIMHFARLANTLLKDEESARDKHVLAGITLTYIHTDLKKVSLADSAINLS